MITKELRKKGPSFDESEGFKIAYPE